MESLLPIAILFVLFFVAYKIVRRVVESDFRKSIIDGEFTKESSKMTIKVSNWFVWNIRVNNEKGTAGGNIKLNFPIKSAFGVGALCVIIAMLVKVAGISLVVVLIFLSFAIYHFRRWAGSIKLLSSKRASTQEKKFMRIPKGKLVAGVCVGLQKRYRYSLALVRLSFIVLTFVSGIGVYLYLILWIFFPVEKQSQFVTDPRM